MEGARQNNLKGVNVAFPLGAITAVTGVSGSGKSSLAFDTLYAEGQRRYVESFSPYARQFMERMDRPAVDRVAGVLPAVAVDQKNTIKASRSTVGTVTELTDFTKLLYARAALLHCRGCGEPVASDTPRAAAGRLIQAHPGATALILFQWLARQREEALKWLERQGYRRIWADGEVVKISGSAAAAADPSRPLLVVADRVALEPRRLDRITESLEAAMARGGGQALAMVPALNDEDPPTEHRFSRGRHCAGCDISYASPQPNLFSYNSPLGACPTCNGFGAVIALDMDLIIPDARRSLAGGAVRPWTSDGTAAERRDMIGFCQEAGVPTDVPWSDLPGSARHLITDGDRAAGWYGINGWFRWLERKTYKMHVRVLLSRYRAYVPCPDCGGARLRPEALLYRLGGLNIGELYRRTLEQARTFFQELRLEAELQAATGPVMSEIRARLGYLCKAGVGYLSLDRQSRTLSGGEVQRVNLTTAIGSALVNTLYVLDEPSVGLHPRDNERLMAVLERLRANRNTIVLVEHDEEIIRRCDHVIDLGPGPGAAGGEVVYAGPPARICEATEPSVTARYLCNKGEGMPPLKPRPVKAGAPALTVTGARAHNLKGVDVALPLERLTVITGVSGSGKSTLVGDVLHRGLLRLTGKPADRPGDHDAILGWQGLSRIVLVDQAPVGTTPRSNPATYVKAMDPIRKAFAATEEAGARGFGPGTFSFNVQGGRCEACQGNGFERVEMQFLADCYVTCEKCGGKRFKEEVLGIRLDGLNIHEVLQLTVTHARAFFAHIKEVARRLKVLELAGLGYLTLGQPLSTLSGGESQRLKLCKHLAMESNEGALFLLDEPTTGLHLGDVRRLLENLQALVDQGNTVVVIEHHLDLIARADWVVDLGPEGGDQGGEVVAAGPPLVIASCAESHTGAYLARHLEQAGTTPSGAREGRPPSLALAPEQMVVRGARVNNLRDLTVEIPRDQLVVVTGPSGSGKSSLAFDVLFAEGQRRFMDCLSPYARQYVAQVARPDLDELLGVPPTVCISQLTSRGGHNSTVATLTEIYHYLRLLYARLGVQHCPTCGAQVSGLSPENLVEQILSIYSGKWVKVLSPAVRGRKGFHKEILKRAQARGHTEVRVDGQVLPLDPAPELDRYREHDVEYVVAELKITEAARGELSRHMADALDLGGGTVYLLPRRRKRPDKLSLDLHCASCKKGFDPPDPRLFSFNSQAGACSTCDGTGMDPSAVEESSQEHGPPAVCPACDGARLSALARSVMLGGSPISELTDLTPGQLRRRLTDLEPTLSPAHQAVAGPALEEIQARCRFLEKVGLEYLGLSRGARTLSGGEAQRVRLASQLSADLRGVLYVLDEPTIGLHPVDNERLLAALEQLTARGNTVLVVEHDDETIRRADYIVDMGPGGGLKGGEVVSAGPASEVLADENSITARAMARPGRERCLHRARDLGPEHPRLRLTGARHHNLRDLALELPLGRLCVVTGVSGSGKSSLVRDVLGQGLRRLIAGQQPLLGQLNLAGAPPPRRVREIDQSPIGKTPASTPATYVGLMTHLRKLFAGVPEARARGFGPARFSYNVKEGRCEHCIGQGEVKHEMSFLPDVRVPCEACHGRRYNPDTLQVRYHGRTIAGVLEATVSEALELLSAVPPVRRSLELLRDVGLDYLTLGQPSNTLSGGEAQRVKLVEELRKEGGAGAFYIMDEPSTGLHATDLERLLTVLQRLVDRGDTVVIIEHNLDFIASADWIVDLGPGGGEHGGQLLYQGPRDGLLDESGSPTAAYLRRFLET